MPLANPLSCLALLVLSFVRSVWPEFAIVAGVFGRSLRSSPECLARVCDHRRSVWPEFAIVAGVFGRSLRSVSPGPFFLAPCLALFLPSSFCFAPCQPPFLPSPFCFCFFCPQCLAAVCNRRRSVWPEFALVAGVFGRSLRSVSPGPFFLAPCLALFLPSPFCFAPCLALFLPSPFCSALA